MQKSSDNNDNDLNPKDLEWCRHLVRALKDGGTWGIPRSGTVFKVDKQNKQLICVLDGTDDGGDFDATKKHFEAIGWTVVRAQATP